MEIFTKEILEMEIDKVREPILGLTIVIIKDSG
jgi:hypothetical protein